MSGSGQVRATVAALQGALAAEHATVWGYGVVGGQLSGAAEAQARTAEGAHRARRDALTATIRAQRGDPVAAEPAYALPFVVTTPASALRLAVVLESRTGVSWRAVLGATDEPSLRRTALAALTDTAVRAARWRMMAKSPTVTVPFPGQG